MHLERIQMLGLVIWRHYLVLFGWCCSPPTPNLPSPPPTHSHDQSRSSTKHLIEIHSVTSDNRELYLYEILKKSTQSTRRKKKYPTKKYPEMATVQENVSFLVGPLDNFINVYFSIKIFIFTSHNKFSSD